MSPRKNGVLLSLLSLGILVSLMMGSCTNPKKIAYFNYVPDSVSNNAMSIDLNRYVDPIIQQNDVLQISVQTIDPNATAMMGTQQGSLGTGAAGQGTQAVPGYMVDKEGYIELPLAGKIKVGGMTISEAKTVIAAKASQFYKNPVVNIRFANFTITVLGEVGQPGQFTVANEKVSIVDAIGIAHDIRITGRRDNIMLIREEDGQKKFVRLDLNRPDLFQSPYFYLRQHDVIYVEPNKNAAAAADVKTTRTLGFVSTGLAIVTLLVTLTRLY